MKAVSSSTIRQWPKIELHVHLDTSLTLPILRLMNPDLTETDYQNRFVAPAKCRSLEDFLNFVQPAIAQLQTLDHITLAMQGLCRALVDDGVIYAEVRFAPLLHTKFGLTAEEVAEGSCLAFEKALLETGLRGGLIFCALRHFSEAESYQTALLAAQFKDRGVVGFDLAGDEAGYPLVTHRKAFAHAKEHQIPATTHCGEALGPQSIRDSLDLGVIRLGHGVRCVEDPLLQKRLIDEQIHLEVCPSSNIQTDVYPTLTDHPIDRLYRAGMSLSVNTDGRAMTDTALTREYSLLQETFGWGRDHFYKVNRMALEAAFCTDELKQSLLPLLARGYGITNAQD